jgi:hypothetical protein
LDLIHGIMPRSFSPTSSIWWASFMRRVALKRACAGLAFLHPVGGELAGLDVFQNALHLRLGFGGDDARAGDILAPLGGVGDRVVHVGDAAFIDQVDDQLHFVQALEIGHFRRVAGFDQRFETGADQFDQAAAENNLLAEQVGFALFRKVVSMMPERPPPTPQA